MINTVNKGEKIYASTINQLINYVNTQRPADGLDFRETDSGVIYTNRWQLNARGSSSSVKRPFDPILSSVQDTEQEMHNIITGYKYQYIQTGRTFTSLAIPKFNNELISKALELDYKGYYAGIKITHDTTPVESANVEAVITENMNEYANLSSETHTMIPLYHMLSGKIETDLRAIPSIPLYS